MERPPVVVDADAHVWEPEEIWRDRLSAGERAMAQEAFWHERGPRGTELTVVNGRPVRRLNRSGLNRYACFRSGATVAGLAELDPQAGAEPVAGAWDPDARLGEMDAMGVDHQVVFPTLFAEHLPVVENPLAAEALARAYNDWVFDFASAAPGRLHPVGVLPLQTVPGALREVERLALRGARAAMLRPAFHDGRYLNHSELRPVWEAIADAGMVAAVHPATGSTNPELTSAGQFVERVAAPLGVGHDVAESIAPVQDNMTTVLALAYYGHLEDLPTLRLSLNHAGAGWLELALEKAETYLWLFPPGPIPVTLEPAELFWERPVLVTWDAWEDAVALMADRYGTVAAWGSRYPRHDATTPAEALATLAAHGVDDATVARMMGANAAEAYRLPVAAATAR